MVNSYDMLIVLLTFVAIVALGGSVLSARAARKKHLQQRLKDLAGAVEPVPSAGPKVVGVVQRIGRAASLGGVSLRLREELTRAGYHGASAASIYLGAKSLLLLLGLAGLPALLWTIKTPLPMTLVISLSGALVLFFLPNMVVSFRRRDRKNKVRTYMPDAVDLLEVCVSAGMGLDMAWNVVGEEVSKVCSVLGEEMELTNVEIHLGSPRVVAMRHLSERVGVEEIGSLVAMMVQSDRFGTSIADTLRTFASSMRETRSMQAQENAERMAVRLLFPLILFIFPALFVVLIGPAWIELANKFFGQGT